MKRKKGQEKPNGNEIVQKQAERIETLRAENDALRREINAYREKEEEIMKTLAFARKTGEEYVSLIKMQYAMESDRIERFRKNLQKYRNRDELLRAYDDSFRELKEMQEELERSAGKGLGSVLKDYFEERERLEERPSAPKKTDLSHADKISDDDLRDLLDQLEE